MFEYVFGFLVGAATIYICLEGQMKYFDKVFANIDKRLERIEEKI